MLTMLLAALMEVHRNIETIQKSNGIPSHSLRISLDFAHYFIRRCFSSRTYSFSHFKGQVVIVGKSFPIILPPWLYSVPFLLTRIQSCRLVCYVKSYLEPPARCWKKKRKVAKGPRVRSVTLETTWIFLTHPCQLTRGKKHVSSKVDAGNGPSSKPPLTGCPMCGISRTC